MAQVLLAECAPIVKLSHSTPVVEFSESTSKQIEQVCRSVRLHLGMEIDFVPALTPSSDHSQRPFHERICELTPEFECGSTQIVADQLPILQNVNPLVRLADATICGMLRCRSLPTEAALTQRNLEILRACADIIGSLIENEASHRRVRQAKIVVIQRIIREQAFSIVYQPIYRLADGSLSGFEALSRFSEPPVRPPDQWFAEAHDLGLGDELEFATIGEAFGAIALLSPSLSLSINISPASIISPKFRPLFGKVPLDRLVLEVTEHAAIENYIQIKRALRPLRARGLRLAVDDVGAGFSSFKHVLDLKPNVIKLDMNLTRAVNRDPARRALADALTQFGRAMGSEIVAEGVETTAELETLRMIGVTKVQGYLAGRPMSLADAARLPLFRAKKQASLERRRP